MKEIFSEDGSNFGDDFDFDFDTTPKKMADMSKREIIGEATGGFYEGAKSNLLDAQKWMNSARERLPKGYQVAWDSFDETEKTITDLYDHAQKEIKPALGQIASKLDSFVPDSMSFVKSVTSSLKDALYDAPRGNYGQSAQQALDSGVAAMIAKTFEAQKEFEALESENEENKERAKDAVKESIEQKRFDFQNKLFGRIDKNLSKLTIYQEKLGTSIDKKNLEINFRSLAALNQIHNEQLRQGKVFQEQLKAVIHHTGLPETRKITASDRFKEEVLSRVSGGATDRVFKSGSVLTSGLRKIKEDGKTMISDIGSGLQMAMMGLDSADMIFGEDAFQSVPKTVGSIIGSEAMNFLRGKIMDPAMEKLGKKEEVTKFGEFLRRYALNPNYGFDQLKKTKQWEDFKEKYDQDGKYEDLLNNFKSYFKVDREGYGLESGLSLDNGLKPVSFNQRSALTLNEVLPGYLARILQGIQNLKLKDSSAPLLKFDPLTGKFLNEETIQNKIKKLYEDEFKTRGLSNQAKWYADTNASKLGLKEEDGQVLGQLLIETTNSDMTFTGENIRQSKTYQNASQENKAVLEKLIERVDNENPDEIVGDLEVQRASLRNSATQARALTNKLNDFGFRDNVINLGFGRLDERTGSMSLNVDRINEENLESFNRQYKGEDWVPDSVPENLRKQYAEKYKEYLNQATSGKKDKKFLAKLGDAFTGADRKKIKPEDIHKVLLKEFGIEDSDVELKNRFTSFDSNYALEGIKKIPVTSWNYKKEGLGAEKHIGPMSQDLYKQFGDMVAPDGKKVNLISMNGITMSAIQGLNEKVDNLQSDLGTDTKGSGTNQISLLASIDKNIFDMHQTLKDKTFAFNLPGVDFKNIDTEKLMAYMANGFNASKDKVNDLAGQAKDKARPLIETGNYYVDMIQSLVVKGMNDLYDTAGAAKDKTVKFSKDLWSSNKDQLKEKRDWLWEKIIDFSGQTLDFGKDIILNQIPEAYNQGIQHLKNIKERLKSVVSAARDVYIKGSESPVLMASRMRAGFYVDSETGQRILSIDTLLKIKGDVFDTGRKEIVLTRSEMADGIFDNEGNQLHTLGSNLAQFAVSATASIVSKAKDVIGATIEWWKEPTAFIETMKSAWSGLTDRFSKMQGLSFYDKRQLGLLVQIRDLMAIGKKEKLVDHVYQRDLEDENHVKGNSFLSVLRNKTIKDQVANVITGGETSASDTTDSTTTSSKGESNVSSNIAITKEQIENLKNGAIKAGQDFTKDVKERINRNPELKEKTEQFKNSALGKKLLSGTEKFQALQKAVSEGKKVRFNQTTKRFVLENEDGTSTPVFFNNEKATQESLKSIIGKEYDPKTKSFIDPKEIQQETLPDYQSDFFHGITENKEGKKKKGFWNRVKGFNHWLKDRSEGSFYEESMKNFDQEKWLRNQENAKQEKLDSLPKEGEIIVSQNDETTIYQNSKGIYRVVKTPQQAKNWSQRFKDFGKSIDDKYKAKHRERTLANLMDGNYTDQELEAVQLNTIGPVEAMGKGINSAKNLASDLQGKVRNSIVGKTLRQGVDGSKQILEHSGDQAIKLVSKLSENPAFQSLMKGLVGFKETLVGETKIGSDLPRRETYTDKMLQKLNLQNAQSSGEMSLKEKAASKWGQFKQNVSETASSATEGLRDGWNGFKNRNLGRANAIWEGAKTVGGLVGKGVSSGFNFLKGFIGEASNEVSDNNVGTALDDYNKTSTEVKGLGDGVKGKNDKDGDGERDGGSTDMLRLAQQKETERKKLETQKAQEAARKAQESSLRYKSNENSIDRLIKGASGLVDFLKDGAGSLLGLAGNVLSMIPGMGTLLKGGKAVLSGAKSMIGGAGKWALGKLGSAANATRMAHAAGGTKAVGSLALNTAHKTLHVVRAASMASGGLFGSMGAIGATVGQAALATLASPLFLKAAVIGLAGYGLFKAYKYLTRNNADQFEQLRLVQYGIQEKHSEQHRILGLEQYFLDGRYSPNNGGELLKGKIDAKEILEIMDIDEKDEPRKRDFFIWLNERFKPFFLRHVAALFEVDNKLTLKDLDKLNFEDLGKYLDKAQYLDGPYNVEQSPFEADGVMPDTSKAIPTMVEKLRHTKKKTKETTKGDNTTAVALDPKLNSNQAAHKQALADEAKKKAMAANLAVQPEAKDTKPQTTSELGTKESKLKDQVPDSEKSDDVSEPNKGSSTITSNQNGNDPKQVPLTTLPVAKGPLFSSDEGAQWVEAGNGVNISGLNPSVKRYLFAMANEYGKLTGKKLKLNDAFRSYAEQADLYRRMPGKAAKPGRSIHEFGMAFDIDTVIANDLEKRGLLRKYGFTRPVGGEGWHLEPAGIQLDIQRSKEDPQWAMKMIEASLGKGGGGYGAQQGSTLKRRNPNYAKKLWESANETTVELAEKEKEKSNSDIPVSAFAKAPVETTAKEKTQTAQSVPEFTKVTSKATFTPSSEGLVDKNETKTFNGSIVEQVKSAAKEAAPKVGIQDNVLQLFAAKESSMGQNQKASTSSAKGPYQFVDGTWKYVVAKHGSKYGVSANDSPFDPYKSALMTGAYLNDNKPLIKKHKTDPDVIDFYLSHMLGPGGVQTFMKMNPEDKPALAMRKAAASNPNVFFKDPKTKQEPFNKNQILENFKKNFETLGRKFNIPTDIKQDTTKKDTNKEGLNTQPGMNDQSLPEFKSQAANEENLQPSKAEETKPFTRKQEVAELSSFNQVNKKSSSGIVAEHGISSGVVEAINRGVEVETKILNAIQQEMVPVLINIRDTLNNMYGQGTGKSEPNQSQQPTVPKNKPQKVTQGTPSVLDRTRAFG